STDAADQLMAAVEKIHNMFWESKGREVTYYEAS
ncbi:MAG TPA: superoxide dismutase, Ni, partial [Acidimicrobiaceae bacterium]|nr:superoxide dismutase, Ni [Acidimicrobiaceae bacterium]